MIIKSTYSAYFERAAVAFLLFCSTGTTVFARSAMTWEDLLMPVLLGGLGLGITLRYHIKLSRGFILVIGGFIALLLAQSFKFGSIHLKYMFLYPLNFWVTYCFIKAMRERLLRHVEFLITWLAGISFVIWSADILTNGMVRQALSGVSFGQPYNKIVDSYVLFQTFINESVPSALPRNAGFAWEPGAFAVFCCFGLMLNFYRNGFKLRRNFGAAVLIAALLSSQSTTGYSIFVMFLLFKLWNDIRGASKLVLFPILGFVIVTTIFSLPFMQDKINNLLSQDINELAYNASMDWNIGNPLGAQRFLSFQLDYADFLNNPWTGYGGEDEEMLVTRESLNVISVSGIGKIMARFGIFGFAFFVWSTTMSSIFLSRYFRAESPALLLLYIFMVSVSYSLIEQPIFLAIWCYWVFDGFAAESYARPKRVAAL